MDGALQLLRTLSLAAAVALLACGTVTAAPQDAGGDTSASAVEVSPGVYMVQGASGEVDTGNLGRIGNAGFIVGDSGVVAIDTGTSYRHGLILLKLIRQVTAKPVRLALITHTRQEFLFGAAAYREQGIAIHMHSKAAGLMRSRCERCLKTLQKVLGTDAMQGTTMFNPDHEFDHSYSIDSTRMLNLAAGCLFLIAGVPFADAAPGTVQIIVPLRATYGASVPVKIVSRLPQTPSLYVKRIYLLVDKNPSPLAAVIDLTTEVGQADFETRLRVDEYSHVRVVAELSNGLLHMDSRYVKTSGGCSAPPNRDAPDLIGKTVLKVVGPVTLNQPTAADVTVVHPNDTGFELNQVTVMYIPAHFVRSIKVSFADQKIFNADLDFSISENPTFRFNFVPHGQGQLKAEVEDSKDGHWEGTLAVR